MDTGAIFRRCLHLHDHHHCNTKYQKHFYEELFVLGANLVLLDSIAVSVFEVILVQFYKYWIWDKQAWICPPTDQLDIRKSHGVNVFLFSLASSFTELGGVKKDPLVGLYL